MLGFQLFLHSLRMVLGNLGAAIRITIPVLVFLVLSYAWTFAQFGSASFFVEWSSSMEAGEFVAPPEGFWAFFPIAFIGGVIAFLWTATSWHRFILLEEHPGALGPQFNGGAIGRYFAAGFVLGLIIFAAALVFGFVGGLIIGGIALAGMPAIGVAVLAGLVIYVPIIIIFYRLTPMLPSAAIGDRLKMSEAWDATRGASGTLLVLAVISVIASFVIAWPVGLLAGTAPIVALVLQIAIQWITSMFGISIMTTIYGVYVEGRELNV